MPMDVASRASVEEAFGEIGHVDLLVVGEVDLAEVDRHVPGTDDQRVRVASAAGERSKKEEANTVFHERPSNFRDRDELGNWRVGHRIADRAATPEHLEGLRSGPDLDGWGEHAGGEETGWGHWRASRQWDAGGECAGGQSGVS